MPAIGGAGDFYVCAYSQKWQPGRYILTLFLTVYFTANAQGRSLAPGVHQRHGA